jgi:hypothetical protein
MFSSIAFLSLALAGGEKQPEAAPAFEITLKKKADRIDVGKAGQGTLFNVTSASGIGDGTIALKAGQWPEHITLRFIHAADKGFTNLERLNVVTDRMQIEGDLKSTGKFRFFFLNAKRAPVGTEKPARASAGTLNVTVQQRNGAIEVTLPACLLIGSNEMRLQWVNEFR